MYQPPTGLQPILTHGSSAPLSNPLALHHTSTAITPAPATSSSRRRSKEPTKAEAEWERVKPCFKQLYIVEDKSLEEVKQILEKDENFRATTDQFTTRIRKWKFQKNFRKREYQHLLRKEEEARASANPSKRKRYTIRDLPVKREKIERFEIDHPNLNPRHSPTPSDIACETERFSDIAEALSQLRLGKQDSQSESLSDHGSGSFDSEVALMVYAPKDPAQKAWNSCVNLDAISQGLGGQSDKNQDDNALEVKADAASLVAEVPRNKPRPRSPIWEQGPIVSLSQRQRRAVMRSSETHDPGAYCLAVSKFDWWCTYIVSSKINSRPLLSTIDSHPPSPIHNSRPLYAANDDDLPLHHFDESDDEEALSKFMSNAWSTETFRGLINLRNTYADEMAYREKAQQHLVLATEAGITPREESKPFPIHYQFNELPWDILLKRDQIIEKNSIDIPWCVSEVLRITAHDYLRTLRLAQLFGDLYLVTKYVSHSEKQKIFDAFKDLTTLMVFCQYIKGIPLSPDNYRDCAPRLQTVCAMGSALMWYFDPFRPRAYVARPETLAVSLLAIDGWKNTSFPMTAFRLITGLRYVQEFDNCRWCFKGEEMNPFVIGNELNRPSSTYGKRDWMGLWIGLNHPIGLSQEYNHMKKLAKTFSWLWLDLDRSVRAFKQGKELMEFLHGRIEQESTIPSAPNTDNKSRSSVDGEPGASANEKSWRHRYESFEAWANQELRGEDIQRDKAIADLCRPPYTMFEMPSLEYMVNHGYKVSTVEECWPLADQAFEDWTNQGPKSFYARAVKADLDMRISSIGGPSKKVSIGLVDDSLKASNSEQSAVRR
ncbi:MAG: hypothetical protein M1821_005037 [Bathelium mastoideum]|nr:MAG: hypothetical protein M1821_005037 [Bathelium mastoideum]